MEQRDLGAPDLRIHYVRVTNNLDVPFTDRWDGIPVAIMPGKSENFQLEMAAHFFGYYYEADPKAMFRHTCKRQGWNTPNHLIVQPSGKTLAEELFAKVEIVPIVYKMVEVKQDLDAPIPADPPEIPVPAKIEAPPAHRVAANVDLDDAEALPPLPPRKKAGAS